MNWRNWYLNEKEKVIITRGCRFKEGLAIWWRVRDSLLWKKIGFWLSGPHITIRFDFGSKVYMKWSSYMVWLLISLCLWSFYCVQKATNNRNSNCTWRSSSWFMTLIMIVFFWTLIDKLLFFSFSFFFLSVCWLCTILKNY